MGKDNDIKKIRENIIMNIDTEFQQFLLLAQKKNAITSMFDVVLEFINKLDKNADILNEIFLKNFLLIMAFVYMFTLFLPIGGEFIATIIRYIFCVICGMYVCSYLKEQRINSKETIESQSNIGLTKINNNHHIESKTL